mmetsp:Transcript_17084/g.44411  ORF Transcript_17084/g.44411 Transcript_17084/m.44411 type:complete len:207 (+) Transcript_17084:1741-2361(+)
MARWSPCSRLWTWPGQRASPWRCSCHRRPSSRPRRRRLRSRLRTRSSRPARRRSRRSSLSSWDPTTRSSAPPASARARFTSRASALASPTSRTSYPLARWATLSPSRRASLWRSRTALSGASTATEPRSCTSATSPPPALSRRATASSRTFATSFSTTVCMTRSAHSQPPRPTTAPSTSLRLPTPRATPPLALPRPRPISDRRSRR